MNGVQRPQRREVLGLRAALGLALDVLDDLFGRVCHGPL